MERREEETDRLYGSPVDEDGKRYREAVREWRDFRAFLELWLAAPIELLLRSGNPDANGES